MEGKFLKISYLTGRKNEDNTRIVETGYIIKEFIQSGDTYYLVVETLYKPCEIEVISPHRVVKFHSYWNI